MTAWGLIVAAGSGERLGTGDPKAFRSVGGVPMLAHSIRAFERTRSVEGVMVVAPKGWEERAIEVAVAGAPMQRVMAVTGGTTRAASVQAGLAALRPEVDVVVVHDAARPLVTAELIERALKGLGDADGAICALPVADTIKRADFDRVAETVPRGDLWRAQTPQVFRVAALRDAHERAQDREPTDDAQVLEWAGKTVVLVPGDARNLKITTPDDLTLAETLLGGSPARVGQGYDVHGFAEGRPLILGGVEIPADRGLEGHSDADVLSHAIADALLGAAALGDLGSHFPSSDERWKGAPSTEFLREAARLVRAAGFEIRSVDGTIVLQRPAVAPYREAMRAAIADALAIDVARVGVKATTTDGFGIVGAGEAAAATAVALLDAR